MICQIQLINMCQTLDILLNYEAWNMNLQRIALRRSQFTNLNDEHNSMHLAQPIALFLFVHLMLTVITAMLIYGCIRGRSVFMVPFLGIQLFEFYQHFSVFLTDLEHPINSSKMNAVTSSAYSSIMFRNLISVLYRLYFICVVWKCFKYLRLKELAAMPPTQILIRQSFDVSFIANLHCGYGSFIELFYSFKLIQVESPRTISTDLAKNETALPPDYETAIKACPPPPDYQTAVALTVDTNDKIQSTGSGQTTSNLTGTSDPALVPSTSSGQTHSITVVNVHSPIEVVIETKNTEETKNQNVNQC